MASARGYQAATDGPLMDPNDPTGKREIAANTEQIEAMLAAAEVDNRLPRIIYLRKRGKSYREIGKLCGISKQTCYRLLASVTPKLLRKCGLR